jgi:hypothetical protein
LGSGSESGSISSWVPILLFFIFLFLGVRVKVTVVVWVVGGQVDGGVVRLRVRILVSSLGCYLVGLGYVK